MNQVLITVDVDWAPEEAIQDCIELILKHNAKATFYCTHFSEVMVSAQNNSNIELGVHPNYYRNPNTKECLDELLKIYPNAKSIRAHGLYSSGNFIKHYENKGFTTCSDIFMPGHPNLEPVWRFGQDSILLMPYFWEDGNHITYGRDKGFSSTQFLNGPGMKIFNFHPIHTFVNTESSEHYQSFKTHYHDSNELKLRKGNVGVRDFLIDLLESSSPNKTLSEVYEDFVISRT